MGKGKGGSGDEVGSTYWEERVWVLEFCIVSKDIEVARRKSVGLRERVRKRGLGREGLREGSKKSRRE